MIAFHASIGVLAYISFLGSLRMGFFAFMLVVLLISLALLWFPIGTEAGRMG